MSIKIEWFKNLSSDKLKELAVRLSKSLTDKKVCQELPPDLYKYITTENTSHKKPQHLIEAQNEGVRSYILDGKEHWGMGSESTRIHRCRRLIDTEVLARFYKGTL